MWEMDFITCSHAQPHQVSVTLHSYRYSIQTHREPHQVSVTLRSYTYSTHTHTHTYTHRATPGVSYTTQLQVLHTHIHTHTHTRCHRHSTQLQVSHTQPHTHTYIFSTALHSTDGICCFNKVPVPLTKSKIQEDMYYTGIKDSV